MPNLLIKDRYLVQRVLVDLDHVTRSVAVDTILGREVLLTQLQGKTGRQAAVQERFQAGAQSATQLSHSHIVALYDIDSWNGLPIVIQEYAQSETLRDIIVHEAPFHPDDVGVLVEHVAEALDFADQRGIHHLALRPEAVFIDYDGQAMVTDFGLGHVLDGLANQSIATIPYRAPELTAEGESGHLVDVYALGVIAFQMLTGRLPFSTGTVEQYQARVKAEQAVSPSEIRAEVPAAVGTIVLRAIARDPANRFPTAAAFADALVNWRDFSPIRREHTGSALASTVGVDETQSLPSFPSGDDASQTEGTRSRIAATLAWVAVAVGLGALLWAGYQVLDDDGADRTQSPTRIAINLPSRTGDVTPTPDPEEQEEGAPTAVSLVGSTMRQAESLAGVPVRAEEDEPSGTVPEGQIIRQSPEPGQPLTTDEIVVVLSSGPEPVDLSQFDIEGLAFEDAARNLTASGVNVLRVDEGSDAIPEGLVIRIDESTARPGETVQLVVSMGDRVQIPPDLLSQPVDDVVATLENLGFDVGTPVPVSEDQILSAEVDLDAFEIEDGDVVGIQEADAGFGVWLQAGSALTPVYFDDSL